MTERVEFTVRVSMQRRWVPHFLGMLKTFQRLGGIGASRPVVFYADGDGDFRPKFLWDTDIVPVEREEQPLPLDPGPGRRGFFFDAG